ncbi:cation-transporting P-type ATPase [Patescibacteria group bacterium]|nr:cation-transporting P-type ATPase [Patescibacteria group bacterium]
MGLKEGEIKKGLNSEEAKKRLEDYGPNELKETNKISVLEILARQIRSNFVIYLLLFATIISFLVGKNLTAYVIIIVLGVVISTGFLQEYKAERAMVALKRMITPISTVIRNGEEREIPSNEIVPGDILILRTGERIPADSIVVEQVELLVNESILTGESKEVKKFIPKDIEDYSDKNTLFMGSFIVSGKCKAKVIKTGMQTKFGKIAGMISETEKELPLQKKVNKICKYLAIAGSFMAVLTGAIILLQTPGINNELIMSVLVTVIAIAVASFPEGFPVVLITALASGSYQMAKKNAIVNRMSIIETLGETTIICSDKTGTITKGEMTAGDLFTNQRRYKITGVGYDSEGDFILNGRKIDPHKEPNFNMIFRSSILCNEARITKTDEENIFQPIGMPTEAALLVMAAKGNFFREGIEYSVIKEIPFSSERKMMTVLCNEKGKKRVYSKGALEVLIQKCNFIQRENGVFRLLERDKKRILEADSNMTSNALRTIALAYKEVEKGSSKGNLESDLIFLGLVGIEDPPREEIKEAIETCREAGIRVKMITGDNKETAIAIAKKIGFDKGKVLEGRDLDSLNDEDLVKIVDNVVIFARVRPEHKLRIVKALKEKGEIVTMTGDGVNDSPALKEAHIGVAMGKNGTDVSRSVSDLTLKDDNFATIVDAIKEGRRIFTNIQKFSTYQISVNFSQVFLIFLGILIGLPLPLLAIQILFMNLFSDELTALTLAFNPYSKDIMSVKPRSKSNIITKPLFRILILAGLIICIGSLFVFYYTHEIVGEPENVARTTTFVTMVLFGITNAYNFRSFRKLTCNRSPFVNKPLVYASLIVLFGTLLIVYNPFLNSIFETVPIHLNYWVLAILVSLSVILIFDILKYLNNKKHFWTENLQELNSRIKRKELMKKDRN